MARKLRVQFEGAIYHVTARGVDKRVIFDDDRDRAHFVERLSDGVEEYGVRLYLFCLMPNHFHLLVETPKGNLSAFMHKVQTAHTVFYNIRHQRAGHLLQGRYGAKLVQGDAYLGRLSRYIHLNPVYTKVNVLKPLDERITQLRRYTWSSYRGYAGLAAGWGFVDETPILASFGAGRESDAKSVYRQYVEAGLAKTDEAFMDVLRESSWGIGDDGFKAKVRSLHSAMAAGVRRPEDVAFRSVAQNLPPEDVLKVVADSLGVDEAYLTRRAHGCKARAVAAKMLMRYCGMSQRDAAARLHVGSGAAVCQQQAALRLALSADERLADTVAGIEARLTQRSAL